MNPVLIIHHWLIDHESGSLIHQTTGEQRRLGEYQFKLLLVLAEHAGQTLTREELTNLVWERRIIGNNSLPNAIHALRLALEDDGKQQRIIKTIPKKGYILESEFCQFVTPVIRTDVSDDISVSESSLAEGATQEIPQQTIVASDERPSSDRKPTFWRWLIPLQLLIIAGLAFIVIKPLFTGSSSQVLEQNTAGWSNIRVVEVHRGWDAISATQDLHKQLGTVLFALNQMLQNRNITMDVFFHTSGLSLKYTIIFKTPCERRQLAMNILNWRTDGQQLRALIYRESERKINEMANCVTGAAGNNTSSAGGNQPESPERQN